MRNKTGNKNSFLKAIDNFKKLACSKAIVLTTVLFSFSQMLFAQPAANEKVQMADGLRSNGKIYVVVAVLLTVLAGLIIYVINIDRKISKLEKENQHNNRQ